MVALGLGAGEFLGTQRDSWDTQLDMLFTRIGGVVAVAFFPDLHDRLLERLPDCSTAA